MKKEKAPSLIRQIITIHHEQALYRRAMRNLAKLDWSVEFLSHVVQKASKEDRKVEITLVSPNGGRLIIRPVEDEMADFDDDILNHLDDDAMVRDFIARSAK